MRSGTGGARGWSWIWDAAGCGEEGSRCGPCSVECCTCSSLPSQGGIDVLGSVGGSKAIIITTKIVIIVVSAERIDQEGPEPDGPHPLLHQRQGWAPAAPRLQSCPLLPGLPGSRSPPGRRAEQRRELHLPSGSFRLCCLWARCGPGAAPAAGMKSLTGATGGKAKTPGLGARLCLVL